MKAPTRVREENKIVSSLQLFLCATANSHSPLHHRCYFLLQTALFWQHLSLHVVGYLSLPAPVSNFRCTTALLVNSGYTRTRSTSTILCDWNARQAAGRGHETAILGSDTLRTARDTSRSQRVFNLFINCAILFPLSLSKDIMQVIQFVPKFV
jgi:hypothetical protein